MDHGMMKGGKGKKKGLISKTWERCKSIGRSSNKNNNNSSSSSSSSNSSTLSTLRSKSWPSGGGAAAAKRAVRSVAPEGCFSVYVGPHMQRFVIKTEYANHPLFKMLLEEAESEYGYSSQGPLALPCNVDVFIKVLMQMEMVDHQQQQQHDDDEGGTGSTTAHQGCAHFGKRRSRSHYHLLSPSTMLTINHF